MASLSHHIPAMENPLVYLANLTNITYVQHSYPSFYNVSSNVNLSILPNNLASLTFNATDPYLYTALPLLSLVLNGDAIRMSIECIYPLSGAYDKLSRLLFYGLMVFSLIFQRYEHISMAALGTAMTYAAVSAIHALALFTIFTGEAATVKPFVPDIFSTTRYIDPDIYGLFPILAISGIMLTPILMWSSTVRNHHGQIIILGWGTLILLGLGAVVGIVLREHEHSGVDRLPSFALCANQDPICATFAANATRINNFPRHIYKFCECIDFCSTYSPDAPMRGGTSMVAWSTTRPQIVNSPLFKNLVTFGIPVMVFICISGLFGLLSSRWSPEHIRHAIFTSLNGTKTANPTSTNRTQAPRKLFAKSIALLFFSTGLILTALAPIFFVLAVIVFEVFLLEYPQIERTDAVGAWGTSVGAALVILAAGLASLQDLFTSHRKVPLNLSSNSIITTTSTARTKKISLHEICVEPAQKARLVVRNLGVWWRDPEHERWKPSLREVEARKDLYIPMA